MTIEYPQRPRWPDTEYVRQARAIAERLKQAGHEAWWVGGCVRNWLLDLPLFDIDIATDATPDQIAELFGSAKSVGAHFGVMLVRWNEAVFEVATFRAEGAYVDRRRPVEVRFGSREEDWQRRDFTINAMYYDPVNDTLFDPAGGEADLQQHRLRTVGEAHGRFDEDALRLMRAVRFAARYDLSVAQETLHAMIDCAEGLGEISPERIAEELNKILTGPHRGRAMQLLAHANLWDQFMPEIMAMRGCEQPPQFHPEGDVFTHTMLVLDALEWPEEPIPAALALGALLHDVGKPPTFEAAEDRIRFPEHQRVGAEMVEAIGRRLRWPNRLTEQVKELVAQHMKFMDVRRMKRSTLRRFLGEPDIALHLALHRADCIGSHGKLENYRFCLEQLEAFRKEAQAENILPDPLINGRDLLAMGLRPGPRIGELLETVRDRQLEGELETRDAALEWVREHEPAATDPPAPERES